MIRVGITGQNGFIGSHLYNKLSLLKEEFELVEFQHDYFEQEEGLKGWVSKCDVIVHLAGINRHHDQEFLYNKNIEFVERLINAAESVKATPHIIFSSSSQEALGSGSVYGSSKKEGRRLFEEWSKRNNALFTGLIIPNVFGPFGKPFYNSVIATFCYLLNTGGEPVIDKDNNIKLIYVGDLVDIIISAIRSKLHDSDFRINHTVQKKVSDILKLLIRFKSEYKDYGILPLLHNKFEIDLFNTFRSFINHQIFFPVYLKQNKDARGSFYEMIKLYQGGQVSFSTTHSGMIRGNHFHTRKIERFLVIKGRALIRIRKFNTSEVIEFQLDGEKPAYVDMPIWYVHNIINIGKEDLYTVFWINEVFDPNNPDTYFENV